MEETVNGKKYHSEKRTTAADFIECDIHSNMRREFQNEGH